MVNPCNANGLLSHGAATPRDLLDLIILTLADTLGWDHDGVELLEAQDFVSRCTALLPIPSTYEALISQLRPQPRPLDDSVSLQIAPCNGALAVSSNSPPVRLPVGGPCHRAVPRLRSCHVHPVRHATSSSSVACNQRQVLRTLLHRQ